MKRIITSVITAFVGFTACGAPVEEPEPPPIPPEEPPTTTVRVRIVGLPPDLAAAKLAYAFRDGDGEWTPAPTPVGGVVSLKLRSERYAFAEYCDAGSTLRTAEARIKYRTTLDPLDWTMNVNGFCAPPADPTAGRLSGTLRSVPAAKHTIGFGGRSRITLTPVGQASVAYSISLPTGAGPLLVTRQQDDVFDRMLLVRSIAIGAATTRDFDLQADGVAPETIAVPANAEFASVTHFIDGKSAGTSSVFDGATALPILPAALRGPADRLYLEQTTLEPERTRVTYGRVVAVPGPITPPPLQRLAFTSAMGPNGYEVTLPTHPKRNTTLSVTQSASCGANCLTIVSQTPTEPWLAAGKPLTAPSLHTLPGWERTKLAAPVEASVDVTQLTGEYPLVGYEVWTVSQEFGAVRTAQWSDAVARRR